MANGWSTVMGRTGVFSKTHQLVGFDGRTRYKWKTDGFFGGDWLCAAPVLLPALIGALADSKFVTVTNTENQDTIATWRQTGWALSKDGHLLISQAYAGEVELILASCLAIEGAIRFSKPFLPLTTSPTFTQSGPASNRSDAAVLESSLFHDPALFFCLAEPLYLHVCNHSQTVVPQKLAVSRRKRTDAQGARALSCTPYSPFVLPAQTSPFCAPGGYPSFAGSEIKVCFDERRSLSPTTSSLQPCSPARSHSWHSSVSKTVSQ